MKKIILILFITISIGLIILSCSVADHPKASELNGTWKLNIGNEYSLDTTHIIIEITDTAVIYNDITLDSVIIEKNRLIAEKHYTKDLSFKLDLTLTFETQYMHGYEYVISNTQIDSVYVFGERVKEKK